MFHKFERNLYVMLSGLAVACAFGAVGVQFASADEATQTVRPVVLAGDPTMVVGMSILTRTDNGITMHLVATDMPAGAYTAWMAIFDPGAPAPYAAGRVAGRVIGQGGVLNVSAHLQEGEVIGGHPVFPPGAVEDARGQDIAMVIRYHGPAEPGFIYDQTHTFEPGIAIDALRTKHNAP